MPFTVSAPKTISAIASSYEVTGTGNLDDLVTALSSLGWSRFGSIIFVNPGVSRIYAISGTLTDQREGNRAVMIGGGAHVCWSYDSSASVTLGLFDTTRNVGSSKVHLMYQDSALGLGADVYNGVDNVGKCLAGLGDFRHHSGSVLYAQSGRSDLDIPGSKWGGKVTFFDDVLVDLQSGGANMHVFTNLGVSATTRGYWRTGGLLEARGDVVVTVPPAATTQGVRLLFMPANKTVRVLQPQANVVDIYASDATAAADIIDPRLVYLTTPGERGSIKRIKRTLKVTASTPLGASITDSKLIVTPTDGGTSTTVTTFTGAISVEVLQSTAPHNVPYSLDGTGWTTTSNYQIRALAFGYPSALSTRNVTTNNGINGITIQSVLTRSPLVSVAYAAVDTSALSFDPAGGGTVTVAASMAVDKIATYLFKLAYDDPANPFWVAVGHEPVKLIGNAYNFGAITISVSADATLSAGTLASIVKTTGTVSGAGTIAVPILDANGDSYVEEANGALLKVYSSAETRDTRTNALASNVARYRFTYATRPADAIYLWVKIGATEYPSQITLVAGENLIDLGVTGLLLQMPQTVWANANRTLTQTIPSAAANAEAVRAELATELGRIDAGVSSRLASTGYTAPSNADIAEIKAKTFNLPAQPAAVGSVMTLTAAYDAAKTAAQADALTALTSTNQNEHHATQSAVATMPPAPNAAIVAAAVRTELATELGRIDATVSSRLSANGYTSSPSAAEIATQVETAILTEGDGRAVLQAIASKIGNENLSAVAVAVAVRTELERAAIPVDVKKINGAVIRGAGAQGDSFRPV